MSVPSAEFEYETRWADSTGVEVVSDFSHLDLISYMFRLPIRFKKIRVKHWLTALRSAELVVDLSGVSYVGPPEGTTKRVLLNGRFKYYLFSGLYRKPFLAWTQSYGPFSNALVRHLAKKDLSALPMVMCRGESGKAAVEKLLPHKVVKSFPDVAITLNYNVKHGREIIENTGISTESVATVSPSAVLYSKSGDIEGVNAHVSDMIWLCEYLSRIGYSVLLVPHTFRVANHDPLKCDYAVCKEIYAGCKGAVSNIFMLEGDRSATDLKSIIANAEVHVGARYHSLVAALSSGVPAIALSWHMKYQDLLSQYDLGDYVIPLINGNAFRTRMEGLLKKLSSEGEKITEAAVSRQAKLVSEVDRNRVEFLYSYNQLKNEM